MASPLKFMAETPNMIKQFFKPPVFYVANDHSQDGIIHLPSKQNTSYPNLLVSYKEKPFQQQFELLDLNTGSSIKKWAPDNRAIYNRAYNAENPNKPKKGSDLYFKHPYMNKDSALIINSQLASLLVKIDANSEVVWLNNDRTYHHSIEADDQDLLYVCATPFKSGRYDFYPGSFETYSNRLVDDHITILNEDDGSIVFDKSVIEILLENGYEELLLYKGQVILDPIHLNDVQPALTSTDYWKKGDLLVSCRNISTVFLYRPSTNEIVWLKHSPWWNQHDADFHGENEIVVFGNDVIREEISLDALIPNPNLTFSENRPYNEVYLYNFEKDSVYTPFTEMLKTEKVRTVTDGRCDILDNGDLFFEETNKGRILIGDTLQKKIEYVKRIDDKYISSLFWSRIIK